MEWTNVHFCLRDDMLTIANFRNTMETFKRGNLWYQHMSNCSYVMNWARVFLIGRVVSRNASAWARSVTSARPQRVCDRRGSMIDNLYRKRVSEKKTLSIVRKLCKFCMRIIFAIFNLCNDWRICSIEYSVRFAHTARVCRWRSKPIRALVKGSATRLLDTMASMCPTTPFVGHGINKCLRRCAPGIYECLQRAR